MRVLLFTGKGGVGKTTTAAATAAQAASRGHKTLVVSTDAAHSLGDALGRTLGPDDVEIEGAAGLHAVQVDTHRAFERSWRQIQSYLLSVLDAGAVDPVDAAELTALPGAEEVLALLAVRDLARSGRFDLVCVDCAPTAESLRLLRLPEVLGWWAGRMFSPERRAVRSLRPLLGRLSTLPQPTDAVFEAVGRLRAELADVRDLLTDPLTTSLRLVLTPESVVVAESRRALTALSLHGYRVDAVIANRVFPAGGDGWRQDWVGAQQERLTELRASIGALPLWQVPYLAAEPVGVEALTEVGAGLAGDGDLLAVLPTPEPLQVERTTDGFALRLALPHAVRGSVDLSRHGDELAITVGGDRRLLALPSVLRRCVVAGARLTGEDSAAALVVRFEPDPALWSQR